VPVDSGHDLSIPFRCIRRYDDGPGRPDREREHAAMRYLLMIYGEEAAEMPTDADFRAMMAKYDEFGSWLDSKGWMRGGEALQPTTNATTVSVRDGRRTVTDGPFAETKEQLGGYYLIDAPDLDGAIEAAARIPGAHTGRVEIRPIMEMG
jgi:hypothetical protein